MTECVSEIVRTYIFYNIKSFDMHIMKNSMHSWIDIKTMKQVHCFNNDTTVDDNFSKYFGAWPEAHGIPISILT